MYCHKHDRNNLEAAQLVATLPGIPFAAGSITTFQMIDASCSELAIHKHKAAQLVHCCASLLNSINDQVPLLVRMDTSATFEEAEIVLKSVHHRVRKWVHCGKIKRFLKRAQIGRDLDECKADVEFAMERLLIPTPAAMSRMQVQSIDMMQHHQATMSEASQKLLISPRKVELAVQRHNSGGNDAYELMRVGQERLTRLGEDVFSAISSGSRQNGQRLLSFEPPSAVAIVRNQLEKALLNLHRLTDIPPTLHILNSQVKKSDLRCVYGGPYSLVFEGLWLGERKVTLKAIHILDERDPKVHRLQTRLEHEVMVQSKLKHENVLTMLGIVTNMGPIHIVSPWQVDNVRNYRYDNPGVNPLELLRQAAKGLEYLHDQQIVHGHRELPNPLTFSNNMLVSEEGIVSLSDFGLTQVLADATGRSTMSIATTSDFRWQAPELQVLEGAKKTMASDVFAFGMSVLELLTMKHPYSHRKRDITVLQDLSEGILPLRPEEPGAVPWMSDALWDTLNRCWKWNPEERMLARELSLCLKQASESSGGSA